MLAAAAVAVALPAPSAQADDGCSSTRCAERVARKACAQDHVIPCIRRAALHWHVDTHTLARKARCESRLDPFAWNPSGAAGLFQFLPSTFATTPYAGRSLWRAKWSALAAGYMHAVGRGGEWSCA